MKTQRDPLLQIEQTLRSMLLFGLAIFVLYYLYTLLDASGVMRSIADVDQLKQMVQEVEPWGGVVIVAMMAIAIIINPIPSAPIALVAGALYGHTWGTIYVIGGASLGALGAFWIARLVGYDLLRRLFGDQLHLGRLGSQNGLMGMVFLSRLIPFLSFDIMSYAVGLTPIKTWRFLLATVLGLIPISFVLTHFGAELGAADLNQLLLIVLIVGAVVVLSVMAKAILLMRKDNASNVHSSNLEV